MGRPGRSALRQSLPIAYPTRERAGVGGRPGLTGVIRLHSQLRSVMRNSTRLAAAGGIAALATALLAAPAQATPGERSAAVFVQTDNLAGNTIVTYDRAGDGSLQVAGSYPTGGKGGALTGAAVDFLASQGSLVSDRENRLLYA